MPTGASRQRALSVREQGFQAAVKALLLLLKARDVEVPSEIERRIAACTDPDQMAAWLQRAATATTAAEILAVTPAGPT